MPIRVYKCQKCQLVSNVEFQSGQTPRCKCGSGDLRRVAFEGTAKPTAPSVPQAPSIPTPPPLPGPGAHRPAHPKHEKFLAQQARAVPSGKGLLAELKASKVGVLDKATGARTVNRNAMNNHAYQRYWAQAQAALPGRDASVAGTQAEVKDVIRCVVNNVTVKSIADVWIAFLFRGTKYYLPQKVTVDLSLPLAEMAAGRCRPSEHGNANTMFRNRDEDLPTRVGDEAVTYLEFGWRYRVPPAMLKVSTNRQTGRRYDYVDVLDANRRAVTDFNLKSQIGRRIADDGMTVDAGLRLVISDWGYLFFTATHYESFLIYDPARETWKPYSERTNAGVSWYRSGEPNKNWILPVSAPGYW